MHPYSLFNLKFSKIMCKSDSFHDEIGDDHISTNDHTPLRKGAFDLSDDQKIELIQKDVENILNTLGMDLTDDSLKCFQHLSVLVQFFDHRSSQKHLFLKACGRLLKCDRHQFHRETNLIYT